MRGRKIRLATAVAGTFAAIGVVAAYVGLSGAVPASDVAVLSGGPVPETVIGLNLFGLENYNRQPVFTNLITQSQWFASRGNGWQIMPAERLDRAGWVRELQPGETAPRPLMLPASTDRAIRVRCIFLGQGELQAGGIAQERDRGAGFFEFDMRPTGAEGEGAWVELVTTDPKDPLRNLDCREAGNPPAERFHPEFVAFAKDFRILRFFDWSKVNDNRAVTWDQRALPTSGSQVGAGGASIEDMIDLANITGADPWLLVPYRADEAYVRGFAKLVHARLAPARTVYVELGNEIWNDMFEAARQAQSEGLALRLGRGDPTRAQMARYADKLAAVMRSWTAVFADRPGRLVRVAAAQNANPELGRMVLSHGDTARWVDALATAPYIWLDINGRDANDIDAIFAQLPQATERAIADAEQNKQTAQQHGKRFIAYEGGQHLVTKNIVLAKALQRDPRMAQVYQHYLEAWRKRIGSAVVLYASTGPISEHGSWGLREYAGQPLDQAPKLQAVRQFLARTR